MSWPLRVRDDYGGDSSSGLAVEEPTIKNDLRMDVVGLYAESLVVTYDPS